MQNPVVKDKSYSFQLPRGEFSKSMLSLDTKTTRSQYPSLHINSSLSANQTVTVGHSQSQMFDVLSQQESEVMLEMSRLHPNSFSFSDKYQQYVKIRNLKSDLEKQMILNQISFSLGNLQPKSSSFSIPRSSEITESLQQGYGEQGGYQVLRQGGKGYIEQEGFVVRIDYASFIPAYFSEVQIHFGVFKKGQAFFEPYFHSSVKGTDQETSELAKCVLAERRIIQNVQPHVDQVLYFEMYANEKDTQRKKLLMRAWTMHEIFDDKLVLNCGRFKLPFYNKKINPKILLRAGLPQIQESSLFIRICLPHDAVLEQDTYVYREAEYKIPFFHLREVQVIRPGDENGIQNQGYLTLMSDRDLGKSNKNDIDLDIEREKIALEKERLALEREKLAQAKSQENAVNLGQQMILDEIRKAQGKAEAMQLANGLKSNRSNRVRNSQNYDTLSAATAISQSSGLVVKIINVNNMQSQEKNVKITIKLMIGESLMEERNTNEGCHHSFRQDLMETSNSVELSRFFKTDILKLVRENRKDLLKNCFLRITLTAQTHSIGWTYLPLFRTNSSQSQINQGTFKDNLFLSPARRPPFTHQNSRVQEVIEYIVEVPDQTYKNDDTTTNQRLRLPSPLVKSAGLESYPNIQDRSNMSSSRRRQQEPTVLSSVNTESVENSTANNSPREQREQERNILAVDLQVIKDFTNTVYFAYDIAVVYNGQPVKDEFVHPTIYNCKKVVEPTPEEDEVKLNSLVKLAVDVDVILAKKPTGWQHYELLFKMVQVDQESSYEKTIAWLIHPLFSKGKPNYGRFDKQLFMPPMQKKSPVDMTKVKYRKEHLCYSIKAEKVKESQYEDFRVPLVMVSSPPTDFSRMDSLHNDVRVPSLNHITLPDTKNNTKTSLFTQQKQNPMNTQQSFRDNKSQMNSRRTIQNNNTNNNNNNNSQVPSNKKRVYKVQLEYLKGIEKPVNLFARVAIIKDDEPIIDDVGDPATFQGEVQKQVKSIIKFDEEFVFEIDMQKLHDREQDNLKNIYLLFYFLEANNQPMYWYYCQLFKYGKQDLLQGEFNVRLYRAPLQRLNEIKLIDLKSTQVQINFFLQDTESDGN